MLGFLSKSKQLRHVETLLDWAWNADGLLMGAVFAQTRDDVSSDSLQGEPDF